MPLTCARCGAQNPDGNRFCQACGTPLTAAAAGIAAPPAPPPGPPGTYPGAPPGPPPAPYPPAPPGPPPGTYQAVPPAAPYASPLAYPSPPPVPAAYQSPYYVPGAGAVQAPVHRVPLMLIVSAVVVLVLLMAGIATAIAIIGIHNNQAGGSIASGLPSPSPGGSPSPVGSATSSQATTATNPGLSVPVPAGWSVANKDSESITLTDPNAEGAITVASGLSNPAQSAQQNRDSIDKYFTGKYPDAKSCPTSQTTTGALNGASGLFWTLCFTLTSGGQSIPAASSLFVGASTDGGVYYLVELVTRQDNLQSFVSEAKPVLAGIRWKLS